MFWMIGCTRKYQKTQNRWQKIGKYGVLPKLSYVVCEFFLKKVAKKFGVIEKMLNFAILNR